MTQPYPVLLRPIDSLHERAHEQLNALLTQIVTALQAGEDAANMPRRVDASLVHQLDQDQVLSIAAVAVARLAGMHHAVEQLADQWAGRASIGDSQEGSSRIEDCVAELRKLVDDHG